MAASACLVGYGPDPVELRVAQADFVVRLFASGYPAEMPFEQPAHFEMAINTRVAAAIGIELRRARDEVIEHQGDVAYWHFSEVAACPTCVRDAPHNGHWPAVSVDDYTPLVSFAYCTSTSGAVRIARTMDIVIRLPRRHGDEGVRQLDAKRLCRLHVDGQAKACGLLNWQIARLGAAENGRDVIRVTLVQRGENRSISDETTALHHPGPVAHGWYVLERKRCGAPSSAHLAT